MKMLCPTCQREWDFQLPLEHRHWCGPCKVELRIHPVEFRETALRIELIKQEEDRLNELSMWPLFPLIHYDV